MKPMVTPSIVAQERSKRYNDTQNDTVANDDEQIAVPDDRSEEGVAESDQHAEAEDRQEHPGQAEVDVRLGRIAEGDAGVDLSAGDLDAGVLAHLVAVRRQLALVREEDARRDNVRQRGRENRAVGVRQNRRHAVQRQRRIVDRPHAIDELIGGVQQSFLVGLHEGRGQVLDAIDTRAAIAPGTGRPATYSPAVVAADAHPEHAERADRHGRRLPARTSA